MTLYRYARGFPIDSITQAARRPREALAPGHYIGHNYTGHTYIDHNYIGHNYCIGS